jgi:hypothetical protein
LVRRARDLDGEGPRACARAALTRGKQAFRRSGGAFLEQSDAFAAFSLPLLHLNPRCTGGPCRAPAETKAP